MLSKKHVQDVCMVNSIDVRRCRFLVEDDTNFGRWHCLKLTSRRSIIDVELETFVKESRRKGQDPYKSNLPFGDNCGGYPIMRTIEQGYDRP